MIEIIKAVFLPLVKPIIQFFKFTCKLHWTNQLIMLSFLAFISFLVFEFMIAGKEQRVLPESWHNEEVVDSTKTE